MTHSLDQLQPGARNSHADIDPRLGRKQRIGSTVDHKRWDSDASCVTTNIPGIDLTCPAH
ncbi:Uncharacterised protein [Yersinia bercovieri]|nr:Uncharacterised protein [Yersinia bercovieri]